MIQTSFKYKTIKTPNKKQGFSLVELMITVAIAGIAISIAIPGLTSFLAQMRVDNRINELQKLLLTTRNAAINSGQDAVLCPLRVDNTCDNITTWTGRIGVITVNGLIKEREAIKIGDNLSFNSGTARGIRLNTITYTASGQISTNNFGIFSYCPREGNDYSRGVTLSFSGRTSLSVDDNKDGRDDVTNQEVACE